MHSITALTLLHVLPSVVLAVPPPTHWTSIKPFADAKCSEPLKMLEGEKELPDGLKFGIHINDQKAGSGEYWDDISFPDADPEAGNTVYWTFPESAEDCVFILMEEKEEGWQRATSLPGRILAVSEEPGCFYTSLKATTNLITGVCCGNVNCAPVDMGSGQILTGMFPTEPESPQKLDCKVSNTIETGRRTTGPQQAITNPQPCSTEVCKFAVSDTMQFSRAVSVSETESYDTTLGFEVSVEAGVKFIAESSVTTSFSSSFSEGWSRETGHENTTTVARTVVQEMTQPAGTFAMLTFTPIYYCDKVEYECSVDGNKDAIIKPTANVCNPHVMSGGIIAGEYTVVYLG